MTRRPSVQVRRPSFTLIEVVVALGLGVVLMVGVQRLTVQGYRAYAVLQQRQAQAGRYTLACELLGQDLAQLLSVGSLALRADTLSLTTGNAMQSTRVATRHAVVVRYAAVRCGDNRFRLLRDEHELGQESLGGSGVVLADGLTAVTWEVHDGQSWHTLWPLPVPRAARAVRVGLQWADGHQEQRVFALAPLHWGRHDG
jgi:hypothetical protein